MTISCLLRCRPSTRSLQRHLRVAGAGRRIDALIGAISRRRRRWVPTHAIVRCPRRPRRGGALPNPPAYVWSGCKHLRSPVLSREHVRTMPGVPSNRACERCKQRHLKVGLGSPQPRVDDDDIDAVSAMRHAPAASAVPRPALNARAIPRPGSSSTRAPRCGVDMARTSAIRRGLTRPPTCKRTRTRTMPWWTVCRVLSRTRIPSPLRRV